MRTTFYQKLDPGNQELYRKHAAIILYMLTLNGRPRTEENPNEQLANIRAQINTAIGNTLEETLDKPTSKTPLIATKVRGNFAPHNIPNDRTKADSGLLSVFDHLISITTEGNKTMQWESKKRTGFTRKDMKIFTQIVNRLSTNLKGNGVQITENITIQDLKNNFTKTGQPAKMNEKLARKVISGPQAWDIFKKTLRILGVINEQLDWLI